MKGCKLTEEELDAMAEAEEFFRKEIMTNGEKMAHEYAIENWEHYEEGQSDYDALKQAHLAGQKTGRPKWHKVADGDLPSEEDGWAWVCNQDGLPCFFNWGTYQWLDCEGAQIRTTEWCYMPHFSDFHK